MSQPLLSIGMIVKNEERSLEKCLKALEPLRRAIPCELVIADTGSTDKTKEIASKYADILFDFKWVNDFSKARNAVMDKCNGKWYLTVDADEYLNSSIDELTNFLSNNSNSEKTFATIIQRNYNDTAMRGSFTDFNAVRLVRSDVNPRYEGTIHESFFISDINKIQILKNTVFDHDGYTALTPDHLKKKEERNLKLLEKKLSNEPDNARCILLCLEASSLSPEKKRYYAEYAFKTLRENVKDEPFFKEVFGPPCISTAIGYAIEEHHTFIEEPIKWAIDTFPEAPHILIDVNFYYAKLLHQRGNYELCAKISKKYLNELSTYLNNKNLSSTTLLTTPIKCVKKSHIAEITAYLISALIKLDNPEEAKKYLSQIDLSEADTPTFNCLFNVVATPDCTKEICETAGEVISAFFEKYHNKNVNSNEPYNCAISVLINIFSCTKTADLNYSNFRNVNCDIGLSAKIADAKSKETIENYLNKIEHWEEFMPVALRNALLFNADLPKEFFLTQGSHLNTLIQELVDEPGDIFTNLTENYLDTTKHNEWYEVSFSFNLLFTILMSNTTKINSHQKLIYTNCFYKVSDLYLSTCYNANFISDENNLLCLSPAHIFAWYFVKAMKEKDNNPLEYIKFLKLALKNLPQAKHIIEFLIEEFKNNEEKKKQEQIKNAAPELLAMAEQLKAMLSALPPNSPELLAIKQSPVYKQVSFLIEE